MRTDAEIIDLYNERVAIMQYEAGLDESKACYQAYLDIRRIVGRGFAIPEEIAKEVRRMYEAEPSGSIRE